MRILMCGINYAPDIVGVAKYSTEMTEWLAGQGHDVCFITAPPYYPAWLVPLGQRVLWPRSERRNGVSLTRVPIYVPRRPGGLHRLLHHGSFALASAPSVVSQALRFRPDVMVAVAPSIMSAVTVSAAAKLLGIASWLHVQDFEVDAAFELGLLRSKILRSAMLAAERAIIRSFDNVSTISPQMVRRLIDKGISPDRVKEFRNWVDTDTISSLAPGDDLRTELGFSSDDVIALYAGTMSSKQGLDVIADAARNLKTRAPNVIFLLCGDGPYRSTLESLAAGLPNMRFLPFQNEARFARLLSTADIHLLPQRAEAADLVLPSKLGGILASGRPVIAMAAAGTGLADEIDGAGLRVAPGDAQAFAEAILTISQDRTLTSRFGEHGRARAQQLWRKNSVLSAMNGHLNDLVRSRAIGTVK